VLVLGSHNQSLFKSGLLRMTTIILREVLLLGIVILICYTNTNPIKVQGKETFHCFSNIPRNILILVNRGPVLPGAKIFEGTHQNILFYTKFFSQGLLKFLVWRLGYPGVSGKILVLRTFPKLVWRSVQNLAEIGLAIRA